MANLESDKNVPLNSQALDQGLEQPEIGQDLRTKHKIHEALANSPGGKKLDEYFGISTGTPQQPVEEAQETDSLLARLHGAQVGSADLRSLLNEISIHATHSGVDPDALRALMRGSKKTTKSGDEG